MLAASKKKCEKCQLPFKRKPVAENVARMDLDAATPAERAEAALGAVAYAGRFEVSGEEVRHTIFTAVNPNRVGDTQVRRITLSDDAARQARQPFPHPLAACGEDAGVIERRHGQTTRRHAPSG